MLRATPAPRLHLLLDTGGRRGGGVAGDEPVARRQRGEEAGDVDTPLHNQRSDCRWLARLSPQRIRRNTAPR